LERLLEEQQAQEDQPKTALSSHERLKTKGLSTTSGTLSQPRGLRRTATLVWYDAIAEVAARGFAAKAVLAVWAFALVAYPLFDRGWKHGLPYTVAWVGLGVVGAYRKLRPEHMELVQHNYLAREMRLYHALQHLIRWSRVEMDEGEERRFRHEVLHLIASYVRDHRLDTDATRIFVSLLVADGEDMIVVARDSDNRPVPARHRGTGTLVGKALETGCAQVTGNVYVDFPETPPGKPYKSILVVPVKLDGHTYGAVSIDSSRPYHFDRNSGELANYLLPYACLLACTLRHPRRTFPEAG
jgi:hypothetical protein